MIAIATAHAAALLARVALDARAGSGPDQRSVRPSTDSTRTLSAALTSRRHAPSSCAAARQSAPCTNTWPIGRERHADLADRARPAPRSPVAHRRRRAPRRAL